MVKAKIYILFLQEAQVTLSLTNPVENLLKVTLLKIEQAEKGDAKENDIQDKENKPDENADKNDDKNEKENKKESEEEKDKDEHEVKEKSDAEQEKGTEKDEKKDSSHVEVAVSKKPHRSMDNSCESRSFVSTAEVKLMQHLQPSACIACLLLWTILNNSIRRGVSLTIPWGASPTIPREWALQQGSKVWLYN